MENILKALQEYGLSEISPIKLLRESGDNEVYLVGEKNKTILRVSKRLPIEDIKFEYEANGCLLKGGVVVPPWLLTKAGNFYTLVDGKVAVLFGFLEGHHIEVDKDHLPNKEQAYNAGRGLGLMSNAAADFKTTSPRKRNIFSEFERVIALQNVFVEKFEGGKEFVEQVKEMISFGKSQKEIEGFIHNDYRPSNVFFNNKNEFAGIIDFDWSCVGPVIKDLALAVVEWSFPDGATEPDFTLFDAFLEGYNSVAEHKWVKDKKLYSWIMFTTLSDASTYFCDIADDPTVTKRILGSYMYRKYSFFSKL
jgi:Ser/Thr protein kinase RdoA (MazF antagonist)